VRKLCRRGGSRRGLLCSLPSATLRAQRHLLVLLPHLYAFSLCRLLGAPSSERGTAPVLSALPCSARESNADSNGARLGGRSHRAASTSAAMSGRGMRHCCSMRTIAFHLFHDPTAWKMYLPTDAPRGGAYSRSIRLHNVEGERGSKLRC
jgi:hypothetical protein